MILCNKKTVENNWISAIFNSFCSYFIIMFCYSHYHFPFLIRLPTKIITVGIPTIKVLIQIGDKTHIQLHVINFNNFNTIKIIVSNPTNPIPLFCFFILPPS